jgi:hypothetical protein
MNNKLLIAGKHSFMIRFQLKDKLRIPGYFQHVGPEDRHTGTLKISVFMTMNTILAMSHAKPILWAMNFTQPSRK